MIFVAYSTCKCAVAVDPQTSKIAALDGRKLAAGCSLLELACRRIHPDQRVEVLPEAERVPQVTHLRPAFSQVDPVSQVDGAREHGNARRHGGKQGLPGLRDARPVSGTSQPCRSRGGSNNRIRPRARAILLDHDKPPILQDP